MANGFEATIEFKRGKGPESLIRKLRALESNLDSELEAAAEDISIAVMRDAQRNAPVDTGRLRASVEAEVRRLQQHTIAALVGSNVDYAPVQEVSQPYLRPAVEANKDYIRKRYIKAFENAAESAK